MRAFLWLLVGLTLLAPAAFADHAYSHRYIILGRVVDADGVPVQGVRVDAGFSGISPGGACPSASGGETDAFGPTRPAPVTEATGDFRFCVHVHTIPRDADAAALVAAAGVEVVRPVDAETRQTFVLLRLKEALHGEAPDEHVVLGRVWRPAPEGTRDEGVPVYGLTVPDVPVNVTLATREGDVTASTTTNAYGDFAVRVPADADVLIDEVRVEALDETWRAPPGAGGITHVRAAFREPAPPTHADPPPATTPSAHPTTTPSGGPTGVPMTPTAGTPHDRTPLPAALGLLALAAAARLTRRT